MANLMAKAGDLPAYMVLGKLRFDANEIEQWVKRLKDRQDERVDQGH